MNQKINAKYDKKYRINNILRLLVSQNKKRYVSE